MPPGRINNGNWKSGTLSGSSKTAEWLPHEPGPGRMLPGSRKGLGGGARRGPVTGVAVHAWVGVDTETRVFPPPDLVAPLALLPALSGALSPRGAPNGSKGRRFITSSESRREGSRDSVQSVFIFCHWGCGSYINEELLAAFATVFQECAKSPTFSLHACNLENCGFHPRPSTMTHRPAWVYEASHGVQQQATTSVFIAVRETLLSSSLRVTSAFFHFKLRSNF